MKKVLKISVISCIVFFLSCQQSQELTTNETPHQELKSEQTPRFLIENLSKEQRENLDKVFSPQTREIFEKDEKIVLNTNYGKQVDEKTWKMVKKQTILSEQSERDEIMNFLYRNAKRSDEKILCKTDIMFSIEAEFEGKKAHVEFDTFCGILHADGRAFINGREFGKIIAKYVEKYGVDVQ